MAQTIFEELTGALSTGQIAFPPQSPGEVEQDFYKRLIKTVSGVPDPVWEKIPEPAQAWINEGIESVNKQETIKPCPGFQTEFQEFADKVAAEQPAVTAKPTAATKRGIMKRTRQLALSNPSWTWEQLSAALLAEGWEKVSNDTVYLCHQEVKNVLAAADEEGLKLVPKTHKHTPAPEPEPVLATV